MSPVTDDMIVLWIVIIFLWSALIYLGCSGLCPSEDNGRTSALPGLNVSPNQGTKEDKISKLYRIVELLLEYSDFKLLFCLTCKCYCGCMYVTSYVC